MTPAVCEPEHHKTSVYKESPNLSMWKEFNYRQNGGFKDILNSCTIFYLKKIMVILIIINIYLPYYYFSVFFFFLWLTLIDR